MALHDEKENLIYIFDLIMTLSKSLKFDINIVDCHSDQLGELFAVCSTEGKILIFLQNKSTKLMEEVLEIKEHKSCVWKVRWSDFRLGSLLASCGFDGSINVWKIYKCQKEQKFQHELLYHFSGSSSVNSIDWSPIILGNIIAGCDSQGKIILIYKQGSEWFSEEQSDLKTKEPLNTVVWAPNFSLDSDDIES